MDVSLCPFRMAGMNAAIQRCGKVEQNAWQIIREIKQRTAAATAEVPDIARRMLKRGEIFRAFFNPEKVAIDRRAGPGQTWVAQSTLGAMAVKHAMGWPAHAVPDAPAQTAARDWKAGHRHLPLFLTSRQGIDRRNAEPYETGDDGQVGDTPLTPRPS